MLKVDRPICNTGTINKNVTPPFRVGIFCTVITKNIRIFESRIAPSKQGEIERIGGAKQVLVPNRGEWTDAIKITEFEIE